jgi:serine/threonine-protein kinase
MVGRMVGRTFLGRYEITRQLGEGGMGVVYLARQTDLGRQVVVKVMHDHVASDPKFCDRFQREMLLMARFQHPYAVTLYDASLNDPQGPCIVMEYIKGITLDTLLQRNNRLNPGRVARMLSQLCEVLQAAHAAGIVHRDLKPSNLMVVDADSPYEKIKVMDFGLAKLVVPDTDSYKVSQTGAEFAVGTPGYISPEQVRGEELDHRSDLYSVGVLLFEMLTGRLPFTGNETMDVLLAHATEAPPTFASVGAPSWVSPAVEAVVHRCLAKNANERPASARDLFELFAKAVDTPNEEADGASRAAQADRNNLEADAEPTTPNMELSPHIREKIDPNTIVHRMEAWMPDTIALYKLRGFVQDMGGEILENAPGMIRVRLGGPGSPLNKGGFSWFGLVRKHNVVDLELHMERNNAHQNNLLQITVLMRPSHAKAFNDPFWRGRCNHIFCELRSYLAGASLVEQ